MARKINRPEQALQIACMQLASITQLPFPASTAALWMPDMRGATVNDYLFHIPNGGARSAVEGGILKAMGVKSGVPDLFFWFPIYRQRSGTVLSGLFIEMKASPTEKASIAQGAFMANANLRGYATAIVSDLDGFNYIFKNYLYDAAPLHTMVKR